MTAFITGFFTSLTLILAIGAQNAFVLRTGLLGRHVFWVCLTCALSDAILISLGVAGFERATAAVPWIAPALTYGGALFLFTYGALRFRAAFAGTDAIDLSKAAPPKRLWASLTACLAITWLNPHVYLDTMVLLGAVSAQFIGQKPIFAAGAVLASFCFFFSLGFGARLARPLFQSAKAWRFLEAVIGGIIWAIAAGLLLSA